jgi:hypothetical protein
MMTMLHLKVSKSDRPSSNTGRASVSHTNLICLSGTLEWAGNGVTDVCKSVSWSERQGLAGRFDALTLCVDF